MYQILNGSAKFTKHNVPKLRIVWPWDVRTKTKLAKTSGLVTVRFTLSQMGVEIAQLRSV
jgi:hypothetical protein